MTDTIRIPLTAGQAADFLTLDTQEAEARKTLVAVPHARTFAARAIILAHHPASVIGATINVNVGERVIEFTPATPMVLSDLPHEPPHEPPQEAVS